MYRLRVQFHANLLTDVGETETFDASLSPFLSK